MAERKTLADKARLKERDRARAEREARASRKARALTVALACCAAALAVLVGMSGWRLYRYRQSAAIYDQALKLAAIPALEDLLAYQAGAALEDLGTKLGAAGELADSGDPEYDPWEGLASGPDDYADRLAAMDLAALKAENADVKGWIDIPGTDASYPYVQGEDNEYYLRRAWNKAPAAAGSIFMEPGTPADLTGFNTILYGHNMNDGSMFAVLAEYRDYDFWKDHQTIYLTTADGVFRYRVYSARMADISDMGFIYGDPSDVDRQTMLSGGLALSEIYTGVQVGVGSRILTLSTCTGLGRYDVRMVVQAVLEWHKPYR